MKDNVLFQQVVRLWTRIYWFARTWYWRSRFVQSMEASLKRRTEVEQVLFDAAAGKREMLTCEECRALALKLGTPDER